MKPYFPARNKWRRFVGRHLLGVMIFLMVATLVIVVLWPHIVVTVPSGQVGVLWKRFAHGTVQDPRQLRGEGLHLLLPWDKLFLYDLRIQSLTDTYNAISKDGVNSERDAQYPVSTAAQLRSDSSPGDRSGLYEAAGSPDRQSDAWGHC